jgi:hypothetical protein
MPAPPSEHEDDNLLRVGDFAAGSSHCCFVPIHFDKPPWQHNFVVARNAAPTVCDGLGVLTFRPVHYAIWRALWFDDASTNYTIHNHSPLMRDASSCTAPPSGQGDKSSDQLADLHSDGIFMDG